MTAAPIDRDRELAALTRALDRTAAGFGGLLTIEGPAGVGKTVLLRAARDEAMRRSWSVSEVAFPIAPAGQGFVGAIIEGLLERAKQRPVALIIDDLHLGDERSLTALDRVARELDGARVLVVATLRAGQASHQTDPLGAILTGPYADAIEPGPLGDRGVDALLHRAFGHACEAGFVTAAQNVSGGNPLLLGVLADEAARLGLRGTADEGQALAALAARGIDAILGDRLL